MIEVRGSEVQDFLRCRLRWKYRWVDQLVSKRPNNKLFFGTLAHKFLEEWYDSSSRELAWDAMYTLFNDTDTSGMDQVELNEMVQLLDKVILGYVNQYHSDFDKYEVIAQELTFKIPLDDDIAFTGTIDLVLKDRKTGEIWFMDHKTTDSIAKYEKNAVMDRQISRYWWALQQLSQGKGYIWDTQYDPKGMWIKNGNMVVWHQPAPSGFIYNIILKDYPQPPKVLKNGKLSTAKNQNTTYELYLNALLEIHDDEVFYIKPEYEEILEYLKINPREYFKRVEVFRNQAEIDASMNEFWETVKDMYPFSEMFGNRTTEKPSVYRNITQDCHWDCSFKDVCHAGFDGSDVNYLLDVLYTKEEKQ